MLKLILIFAGGGLGSVMRYLTSHWTSGWTTLHHFPISTLICNVVGCLLIGLLNTYAAKSGWSEEVRLMLTVGLCGGFTTFSTFSNEGVAMISAGHYGMYAVYTLLSIGLGVGAVWVGMLPSHP